MNMAMATVNPGYLTRFLGVPVVVLAAVVGCVDSGGQDDDAVAFVGAEQRTRATIAPLTKAPGQDQAAFRANLGALPYLVGDPAGTSLLAAVAGGAPPYSCEIYEGPGEGTLPAGVTLNGCDLEGGLRPEWGDLPGNYGFLVEVSDAAGSRVAVPVVYPGAACSTANVTMQPSSTASMTAAAGSSGTWRVDVLDLDGVDYGGNCSACMTVSALTRSPISASANLSCDAAGDLCVDDSLPMTYSGSCPGTNIATATRFVQLDAHPMVKQGAGFVTVEVAANYSGGSIDPCHGKVWRCHMDVLEVE